MTASPDEAPTSVAAGAEAVTEAGARRATELVTRWLARHGQPPLSTDGVAILSLAGPDGGGGEVTVPARFNVGVAPAFPPQVFAFALGEQRVPRAEFAAAALACNVFNLGESTVRAKLLVEDWASSPDGRLVLESWTIVSEPTPQWVVDVTLDHLVNCAVDFFPSGPGPDPAATGADDRG